MNDKNIHEIKDCVFDIKNDFKKIYSAFGISPILKHKYCVRTINKIILSDPYKKKHISHMQNDYHKNTNHGRRRHHRIFWCYTIVDISFYCCFPQIYSFNYHLNHFQILPPQSLKKIKKLGSTTCFRTYFASNPYSFF